MSHHIPEPERATQSRHPWRATVRTVFAAAIGLAAMGGPIYTAAVGDDPETATGWAAIMLGVMGAITRVLALPGVDAWLHRYAPWLATGAHADD